MRGHLGPRDAGARRQADPDAADAAPVRLDEPAARARRRDARGRARDPPPPGSRRLLPPAGRAVRHRQLRPRPAADRRARAEPRRGRPPDRAGRLHAGALRGHLGRDAHARAAGLRRRHRRVVQRPLRVHARLLPAARRELAHPRALLRRGHLGHARRGLGAGGRRPHRHGRSRHRSRPGAPGPLPAAPLGPGLHPRPRQPAVRRGVRRPAPAAADGAPARTAGDAVPRPVAAARGRPRRERRLGARAVVPVERDARASAARPAPRCMGLAVLVGGDRPRAPRDAHGLRRLRPDPVHQARGRGPGSHGLAEPRLRLRDGSSGRAHRLHDRPEPAGRRRLRSHGDPARGRPLPARHGRRLGAPRRRLAAALAARGRWRPVAGHHVRHGGDRPLGPAGARRAREARPARTSAPPSRT